MDEEPRRPGDLTKGARIHVFLIADVRGYTRFTQQRGDEAAATLAAKFARIARETVQARGGSVIELRGDEALAVFPSAREAVVAAVDLQERFLLETIDQPELPLGVGIGLDAGEAVPFEGGYRGGALNLAARLCGKARPGEILASRGVTHLARRVDGVRYVDGGRVHLKDLAEPIELVRIVPDGVNPVEQLREVLRPLEPEGRPSSVEIRVGAPALHGRARETERIEAMLDGARHGVSDALVIHGTLGSGKSMLLDAAAERADDMRQVPVTAVETETGFAYAGLHALLLPLLEHLDEIANEHARAIESALALQPGADAGRLYVGAATLALLSAAAGERPLLCLVDDAHWLDPASADALRFTARRLGSEGVVILFAANGDVEPGFAAYGLASIRLGGLPEPDALTVLANRYGEAIAPEVARTIVHATGGNPRALVEAPAFLEPKQLRGLEPIVGPIPVSEAHRRAIARRLDALSEEAERALLVAAAADTHTMRVVAQIDETIADALAECENAGFVTLGAGRLVFPDPLVRSAAYQAAPAAARRAAHADLARALEGDPLARERRAWHLAAASVEPDEDVASELVVAAATVRGRRGHAAAAAMFEAAARLSPSRAARNHRALQAARSWWHAGQSESAQRMLPDAEGTDDPLLLADARLLRGRMELAWGRSEVGSLLVSWANEVEPIDPLRAASMLAAASDALEQDGGREAAARAVHLADGAGGPAEVAARLAAARRAAEAADHDEAADHLERIRTILDADDSLAKDPETVLELAIGLPTFLPSREVLRSLAEGTIETARRSSVMALPHALGRAAWIDLIEGRWDDAAIGADEAARLADETGQPAAAFVPRLCSALVEACRGHEEACRQVLDRVGLQGRARDAVEGAVFGALELGIGRVQGALDLLERWAATKEHASIPPGWCSIIDLVEAGVHQHPDDGARRIVLPDETDPVFLTWLEALWDRGDDYRRTYARALDAVEESGGRPFLRARIHLNLGERIRRQGLREEARGHFREAIELFDTLRAEGWSERAQRELRATGETVRKRTTDAVDQLTAQELHIARLLAERRTYKEIAAMLFLSPKTIEFHASKIYRKLGVKSKNDLAGRLKAEPRDSDTGGTD